MAEAPGSRTQPAPWRAATDFEDREGHRAPFASVPKPKTRTRNAHALAIPNATATEARAARSVGTSHVRSCGSGRHPPIISRTIERRFATAPLIRSASCQPPSL
jgi:hypothetical protein